MNGLDLFSGIGGIAIALEPWVKPVAYCEISRYCQGVLLSRMSERRIGVAPIWDDIRTLCGDMLPGRVDLISAGFPCQDASLAGRGRGLAGERTGLVREVFRLIDETQPTFVFLENVPGIRTRGADVVIKELASLGYDCRWDRLSAFDVGAPHKRERWFLLAHANRIPIWDERWRRSGTQWESPSFTGSNGDEESLADSDKGGCIEIANAHGATRRENADRFDDRGWWSIESDVGRMAHGISKRVDRLRALGNSVVPAQAREAFRRLAGL